MAGLRRTTIAADAEALDTLRAEAGRRGTSLSAVVAEAIEEKAAMLRQARQPRLGVGASGGRSPDAAVLTADPIAEIADYP
jgi:hypothetical protein